MRKHIHTQSYVYSWILKPSRQPGWLIHGEKREDGEEGEGGGRERGSDRAKEEIERGMRKRGRGGERGRGNERGTEGRRGVGVAY